VQAKIIAYNSYGFSVESPVGSGAVIFTSPDAPIGITENELGRTPTSITFTWSNGA
jgi:hypothetical protein